MYTSAINHLLFNFFEDRTTPIEIRLTEESESVNLVIQREGNGFFPDFVEDADGDPKLNIMFFDSLLQQLKGSRAVESDESGNSLVITFEKSNNSGSIAGLFLGRVA